MAFPEYPVNHAAVDYECPAIFRTCSEVVYRAALEHGSLWLRTGEYYRGIEDAKRKDGLEGISAGRSGFPVCFRAPNGSNLLLRGDGKGHVGQAIIPHYIASFHGASISEDQWRDFGGWTFGVRDFRKLAQEIYVKAGGITPCHKYRFGPVSYRYTALAHFLTKPPGGPAIALGGSPPSWVNVTDTDVLRKHPVAPFIDQDEWRIAVFPNEYISDDANEPLRINVDPGHFFPYIEGGADVSR